MVHNGSENPIELIEAEKIRNLVDQFNSKIEEILAPESSKILTELYNSDESQFDNFAKKVDKFEKLFRSIAVTAFNLGQLAPNILHFYIPNGLNKLCKFAYENSIQNSEYIPNLSKYPMVLITSAFGLGLTNQKKFEDLYNFLDSKLDYFPEFQGNRIVDSLLFNIWEGRFNNYWIKLYEKITGTPPRSWQVSVHNPPNHFLLEFTFLDYITDRLKSWLEFDSRNSGDFELLMGRFEILSSFVYQEKFGDEFSRIASLDQNKFKLGLPYSRVSGNSMIEAKILEGFSTSDTESLILEAGFGKGKPQRLHKLKKCYLNLRFLSGLWFQFNLKWSQKKWLDYYIDNIPLIDEETLSTYFDRLEKYLFTNQQQ